MTKFLVFPHFFETNLLQQFNNDEAKWKDFLRVSTIDSMQGDECDLVIFSAVRSNENGKVYFFFQNF